jgi:hypothetical protein
MIAILSAFLAVSLSSTLAAQDTKMPAAPQAAELKKDDPYPKWDVHGYLSTDFNVLAGPPSARGSMTGEGILGEFELDGTLHLAKSFRITMRACVGCHGFQLQNAYFDYDINQVLTLRAGRIPLPFGSFSQRANPVQMESTSKPLPYIMGRMVNDKAFNLGIIPAPAVDNGGALLGNVWLSDSLQLGYEAALVRGFEGESPDIQWDTSRDFPDNNGKPAGVGRLVLTSGAVSAGVSGMVGQYDTDNTLDYRMAEADLTFSFGSTNLRLEGVGRTTEFVNAGGKIDTSRRLGYIAQIDTAVTSDLRLFVLHDYLAVTGLYLSPTAGPFAAPSPGLTDDRNNIYRFVGGAVYSIRPGLLLKSSAEYWDFSDFKDTWVFHLELVASF